MLHKSSYLKGWIPCYIPCLSFAENDEENDEEDEENDDDGEEPETIDASELPEFQFQKATFSSTAKESILDLGLLILFNLVFFGGAFFAFLKYDLR
mgnify:CR=1 FL=1